MRRVSVFGRNSRVLLSSVASLLVVSVSSRAEIEWRGTIVGPRGTTFALTDTATGESRWVALGTRFGAFSVERYDPTRQILVLNKEGARTEVPLAAAHVAPAKVGPEPADKPLDAMVVAQNLAKNGNARAAALLQQHRDATVKVDDLRRRIAEAERGAASSAAPANSAAPADGAKPVNTAALAWLTRELETALEQQAAATAQIQSLAQPASSGTAAR
ncbi:hypothetical protein DB347_18105 [Opitutaceae bacterium EW11]|nr:hypothetical protein DB347_18105 [Opitutaceae bacterium EW11]